MPIFVALYAALTFALPPDFRREYARSMRRDFGEALAQEFAVRGWFASAVFASSAALDLFLTALREHAAMIFRDVTFAARSLRKTPFFTIVIVATLALAIGANATAFAILRAVVLAPLPYAHADRLAAIEGTFDDAPFSLSLPDFYDLANGSTTLESAAAFAGDGATMTGRGPAQRVRGVRATSALFATLGVRPELGRFFEASDAKSGAARTIVLSDAFWRATFGGDPLAIGATLSLDGTAYRIVGIAPPDFRQPSFGLGFSAAQYWLVLPADPATDREYSRGAHYFDAVARMRDGVDVAAATADLHAIFGRLRRRYPAEDTHFDALARALADQLVGSVRPVLVAIFAAVGLVLLVACANVANLLLSRATAREREIAVRVAIGATRGRIAAQLLTETFALAVAGGIAGMALASLATRTFVALHPPGIPRVDDVAFDPLAAVYTLAVIGACTLAAGLAPALTLSRGAVANSLKAAGRTGDASRGRRARATLVIAEVALTFALVIGAGLVVRSFVALINQPLGFTPTGLTAIGPVAPPPQRYGSDAALVRFYERGLERVRAIPGIDDAAWSCCIPFGNGGFNLTFDVVGRPVSQGNDPSALANLVSPHYQRVMRVGMLEGREFDDRDRSGAPDVVIVNAAFAKTFFPGSRALGARITWGGGPLQDGKPRPQRTIVGIAADARDGYAKPQAPTIYLPLAQTAANDAVMVVRSTDPRAAANAARALAALDPNLPVPTIRAYSELLARDAGRARLSALALGSLAVVALVLALAGIFAVVSYGVTQRTHEFGIRMALGGRRSTILRNVLAGAMRVALAGVLLGIALAAAGTRLLGDQLYATEPLDPLTFGAVTIAIALAALVAAFVPARRATRVDPVVALRYE